MASGVRDLLKADVGLSVTGVAGPEEQDGQPAGTVFVGLSLGRTFNTPRCDCRGTVSRARLQRHQRARRAASGPRRFELSPGSRLVSNNPSEVIMSSLEIRVDPGAMGFEPARLERIRPHFDAYVEDRRLAGWLATVARGGELVWTLRAVTGTERRISRSPTTRSGVSIR